MSKLKAAIRVLEYVLSAESRNARESSKAAIRVLEAAGKILGQPRENVKQRLILGLDCFTDIKDDEKSENGWWKRQLRMLLESLPDEENK